MYDLHNQTLLNNPALDLKRFGFRRAGVIFQNNYDPNEFKAIKEKSELELFSGVEITAERAGEVKKAAQKFRNQVDVIMVNAKDNRAMRAAAEDKNVDVISHAFVDQTAAREAAVHNVALEINLRDIISVYGMKRAVLISKIRFNLNLARKYKVPLLLTTGAKSQLDMRSPRQIMAVAECIGFTHDEAKAALTDIPKNILERRKAEKAGEILGKGVKRVK